MPPFVSQLIDQMIAHLFPRGVGEAEGERIREQICRALAGEYLERYDWDVPEIIEKVVNEELENLSPELQSALADSVLEHADDRIAEVIREEVVAVLRELTSQYAT
jgi:hypothetical protein